MAGRIVPGRLAAAQCSRSILDLIDPFSIEFLGLSDDDIGLAIASPAICCGAFAGTGHPEEESLVTGGKGGGYGGIKIYAISN